MSWEWAPPIATAVVGITGIVGVIANAVVQRKTQFSIMNMQLSAQEDGQERQEKRKLFARLLAQSDELYRELMVLRVDISAKREIPDAAGFAVRDKIGELNLVKDEVFLSSDDLNVRRLAESLVSSHAELLGAVLDETTSDSRIDVLTGGVRATVDSFVDAAYKELARRAPRGEPT